jgi:hypothetical protein
MASIQQGGWRTLFCDEQFAGRSPKDVQLLHEKEADPMKIRRQYLLAWGTGMMAALAFTLFSVTPAFSRGKPAPKPEPPEMVYKTVPITLQMEAGSTQWNPWTSGTTIIAGTGWLAPLGRSDYHYGFGYDESQEDGAAPKPEFMDESWLSAFPTNNLCIYHLEDGDIYAYDGIMGNVVPATDDGKGDYLLEVIVGGTGKYRNANGILLGRTAGRGTVSIPVYDGVEGPFPLPPVILKIMEGYINVQVEESKYRPMLPAVGSKNPQIWPDAADALGDGYLIPINIEMEAGRYQWNAYESGQTIIAGTGYVEPFGRSDYHYGFGYDEASTEDGAKPDFMNDSWLATYPTNNLCIYHLADGDIYAYDGIVGNLVSASDDGKSDYIVEVIVGGSGIYTGATGMLLGYTFGRGDAAIPDGQTLDIPLPDSIIKLMEGYIIIK